MYRHSYIITSFHRSQICIIGTINIKWMNDLELTLSLIFRYCISVFICFKAFAFTMLWKVLQCSFSALDIVKCKNIYINLIVGLNTKYCYLRYTLFFEYCLTLFFCNSSCVVLYIVHDLIYTRICALSVTFYIFSLYTGKWTMIALHDTVSQSS